uniref:Uncharacterized protein n=1 Tax=Aegilops tauschii subsp. strangulata TaxID=200361 RepID=A0A453E2U7_AEGTS
PKPSYHCQGRSILAETKGGGYRQWRGGGWRAVPLWRRISGGA